jgi:LPXTG-motif cell wall-anchored protein
VFLIVQALLLAVFFGACDLLPQTGTEWGIALGIFGALFITVVIVAWRAAKKANKK